MIQELDIADFSALATDEIWDVRDAQSYQAGHLQYAKNIPLDCMTEELMAKAPAVIYVLCGGGTKAKKAAEKLHEYDSSKRIIHLIGGTRKAIALGMPIITESS